MSDEKDKVYATMPWRYEIVEQGNILVVDKDGHEVPLLTMLNFTVETSRIVAKRRETNAPN